MHNHSRGPTRWLASSTGLWHAWSDWVQYGHYPVREPTSPLCDRNVQRFSHACPDCGAYHTEQGLEAPPPGLRVCDRCLERYERLIGPLPDRERRREPRPVDAPLTIIPGGGK